MFKGEGDPLTKNTARPHFKYRPPEIISLFIFTESEKTATMHMRIIPRRLGIKNINPNIEFTDKIHSIII
jgi:hypothetical protein